jgi:hypothetical protein
MNRSTRISTLAAIVGLASLLAFLSPPIPQSEIYHEFADQREFLGIPAFLNVVSSLCFVLAGAVALRGLAPHRSGRRPTFIESREAWPWVALFLGTMLTGFGSGFYHWAPSNSSLFWDRLPMSVVATSLLAAVLSERIGVKTGLRWLMPLLLLGMLTVVYWRWSENQGTGDLRGYGLVQFLPIILVPLLILLFSPRYTATHGYFAAIGLYLLAKITETWDHAIFGIGQIISGHTLKHLLAAAALFMLHRMITQREPVSHLRNVAANRPVANPHKSSRPRQP